MNNLIMIILALAALTLGGILGYGFGYVQSVAQKRYMKRQRAGELIGWSIVPGSMTRVAFLMAALLLVQIACPMLFEGQIQWIVSTGVVLGYGTMLYRQARERVDSSLQKIS
jgi:hypothetical protein